jgi:hypothetical protein
MVAKDQGGNDQLLVAEEVGGEQMHVRIIRGESQRLRVSESQREDATGTSATLRL